MKKICVSLFLLYLFFAVVPAWALDLNPGLYAITVKTEMQGMPMQMPATTMNQCITEQDPVPNSSPDVQGCDMEDMNVSGNTVTYSMICEQQGMKSESSGETTYNGDSFRGKTTTTLNQAGGAMLMTSEISGQRIGECQ